MIDIVLIELTNNSSLSNRNQSKDTSEIQNTVYVNEQSEEFHIFC